jgi:hypothetical protein
MSFEYRRDGHRKSVGKFTSEDRFFSAIGRFIFEFSQLEYTFKALIAQDMSLADEYFNTIMTHDFALLCTIAEDVFVRSAVDKEYTSSKLNELLSKCRLLNEERNRIVQGLWFVGGKEGRLFLAPSGQSETKLHYEQADEVADLAERAGQYRMELEKIVYYTPPVGGHRRRRPSPPSHD